MRQHAEEMDKAPPENFDELEDMYRTLVKISSEAATVTDTEGCITHVSQQMADLLAFRKAEELLGRNLLELIAPEDHKGAAEDLKKALERRAVRNVEHTFLRKDGSYFIGELNFSAIEDGTGKVKALVSTVRDMTKRKEIEKALRENEEKYRTLTENVNVGVYRNTTGPKGKFIEANPAIVEMFGYESKEDFLRKDVADLYQNPEDRKRFNEKMESEGFVRNEELQLKKKDGTPFVGSVSAVAVKDEKGEIKYYDGIIEDITERKLIEEALRESEIRYRALFDRGIYCVLVHDFEGRFLDANEAALTLLGRTREEIPSLRFFSVLEKSQVPTALKSIEEIRNTGFQKEPARYRLKRKNGEYVWVEVEGSLIYREGKPYAIQGIAQDITDEIRIEKQRTQLALIANDILQRKNLKEILDTVAHAICEHCGFGRLIISLLDENFESTRLAFAGLTREEEVSAIQRHLSPEQRKSILQDKFKLGNSYYIPHNQVPWGEMGVESKLKPEQMKSWHPDDFLFIPLLGEQKKVIGLISVDDPVDGRAPTAESLAPVELFATQAAIAIENARLYEEIRQYTELLESKVEEKTRKREALLETSYRLRETTSWDKGMRIIVEGITRGLGFESAELFLINETRKVLENIAVIGDEKKEDIPLDDLSYIASQCVTEKSPINIREASRDGRVKKQIEPVLESFAWVPIISQHEVLGAISVYNRKSGNSINDEELEDLLLFANQAAHYVESTRFLISPAVENTLSSEMKYHIEPGESYLIESHQPAEAFDIFIDAVTHGMQGFSICRIHPKRVKRKYGLKKTPILWLSTIETEDSVDPKDLAKITHLLHEFLKRATNSVILLEGIEYLIIQNNFEKVIKALHSLNDYITIASSRLLVPISPKTLSEKELSILEKEFRIFK